MALGMTSRDAVAAREQISAASQSFLARLYADLGAVGAVQAPNLTRTQEVQAGADRALANIDAVLAGKPAPVPPQNLPDVRAQANQTLNNIDAVLGVNTPQHTPNQSVPTAEAGISPNVLAKAKEAATGAGAFVQKLDSVLEENANAATKWRDTIGAPGVKPKGAVPER